MKTLLDSYISLSCILDWLGNKEITIGKLNVEAAVSTLKNILIEVPHIEFTFHRNSTIYFASMSLSGGDVFLEGFYEPVSYDGHHIEEQRKEGYFDFWNTIGELWFVDESHFDLDKHYLCKIEEMEFLYNRSVI